MANSQYIVVVGCGRLGSTLASHLSSQGHSVVIIDTKETAFQKLSTEFSGFQIVGDAAELSLLKSAKVEKANCLLAVTNQDNTNLMVAQVAKTVFNVPTVLARVFDPNREGIYQEFGIETISPTKLSVEAFLQILKN
jgi:trk system potassium uptake protein TrkA